ncbi:bile acid-CoA:amino acid N-acyltransferase-like isoform X1 [Haliotis rubra]|uniref:bile acid-CoA:amino acid N-acyltransferase-like isoform X1 n=1 Tax=Haliotis rubra TaxID=36100 RepID=UPI001EE5E74B|nr:bile acid-CoA:amino acid N-acyltransferase-like isoform X1 [Haliotis rubra]
MSVLRFIHIRRLGEVVLEDDSKPKGIYKKNCHLYKRFLLNMAGGCSLIRCKSIRRLQVISRSLALNVSPLTLTVEPSDALIDEPVAIRVSGLQRHQKMTLSALLSGGKKEFVSCAHYTADETGHVDTTVHSSQGGSYMGVEPMGLFWSMVPSMKHRRTTRLLNIDVTVPYDVTISVQSSHLDLESIQSASNTSGVIAATHVRRRYISKGVQRFPIKIGRIRGTLFVPSGDGPFPRSLTCLEVQVVCLSFGRPFSPPGISYICTGLLGIRRPSQRL